MNDFDIIVIGAGPAGINAALTAADAGLRVGLFDENGAAGGQVYRAPVVAADNERNADFLAGENLRHQLAKSPVRVFMGHQIWAITEDYRIDALGPQGPASYRARILIVAAGTTERVVPFEGWTLPGVIGLASATILLKSQKTLPGKTTLVAGCGPLLAAVAGGTLKAGGEVTGIVDIAGIGDWLRTAPAMLARPDILRQGAGYAWAIKKAGVPIFSRHTLVRVSNAGEQLCAELAPCDAAGRPIAGERKRILADCVAVGHGLTPSTDITRLLHAQHRYSRRAGGWIAVTDANGQTSRERLFVVGDAAGIAGAAAAGVHGTLAALACIQQLKPGAPSAGLAASARAAGKQYARAARFGRTMAGLMALREGHVDSIEPATVVCRCEDVTRADIEAACNAGARDVNQLKAWTRCGMGPCQGRTCGDVAAELLARQQKAPREKVGVFSARTPLRPLTIKALTGDFDYDDIPIPKAAPL